MDGRTIRRRRKLRFDGLRKAVACVRRLEGRGRAILRGRLTLEGGWVEVAN